MMQPRKFYYQTIQKNRKYYKFKLTNLVFGAYGLRLLQPLYITTRHLFRYKMVLKKATKRSEKTLRAYWLPLFPTQPITRKSKGSRMGKGKGKRQSWGVVLRGGSTFIEFKNVRRGRSIYYFTQIQKRLRIPTYIVIKGLMAYSSLYFI
jgi:large subunit ribosomal protein L16